MISCRIFSGRYLVLAILLVTPVSLIAQDNLETKTGVIKNVTQKGRLTKMTIEDDQGGEYEISITPKVDFQIQAPGDKGFIAKGQFIQGQGVLTNKRIYLSAVTVFFVSSGKKISRRGGISKAPVKSGQSQNAYLVSGTIIANQADEDFPDYELVALREASRGPFLMLEKKVKVTVATSDISFLPENAKIRMQVLPLRGGRFTLKKATVKLSKPIKSEDVFRKKS